MSIVKKTQPHIHIDSAYTCNFDIESDDIFINNNTNRILSIYFFGRSVGRVLGGLASLLLYIVGVGCTLEGVL